MSIGPSGGRGCGTKDDLSKSTGSTHRGWGTEAIIHVTMRGLDRIMVRTICLRTRVQEAKGYGPLERNNIDTHADRESKMALTLGWHVPVCVMMLG